MCSSDSGEGLTSEEFDLLLATVKVDTNFGLAEGNQKEEKLISRFKIKTMSLQTTAEGMVKISDIVNLLQL